jgi:hypothetical protein
LTALLVLEIPSTSGRLLESMDAANFVGWLGQFVFLSLFVDALLGALPRAFALFAILFYLSYYFAYWEQGVHIALKSEQLRRTNPGIIVDLDANSYSLVMDKADLFAASHSSPVVYTHDASFVSDEYVSYRLMARNAVKQYLRRNDNDVQLFLIYWNDAIQPNVREIKFPERPKHRLLSVTVRDDPGEGWKDINIGTETTLLTLDDRVIGAFKSAYVRRLPIAPLFTRES